MVKLVAGVGFSCVLLARVVTRDFPRAAEVSVWMLAITMCGYGWALALFPSALVERSTGIILPLDSAAWTSFGTVDREASTHAMLTVSAMFMVLLMTTHLARHRSYRVVIAMGVTTSGLIAAIAGLWLQTGPDRADFWEVAHAPSSVFGFFWYHGNAAAFLNLSWPVSVWLMLVIGPSWRHTMLKQICLALLGVSVLTQVIAVVVNVSKMGHLILVLELVLLSAVALRLRVWHTSGTYSSIKALFFCGALMLILIGGGAWLTGAAESWERWGIFTHRRFDDPARRHAAEMAIKIGNDAGWTGTGPGTFEWISPHYAILDPVLAPGHWRHAHNDYAQFYAEWGPLGCLLVCIALILPVIRLLKQVVMAVSKTGRSALSLQRRAGLLCFGVALVAVLIHAAVDFPLQIMATQFLMAVVAGLAIALSLHPSGVIPLASGGWKRPSKASRRTVAPSYFLSGD